MDARQRWQILRLHVEDQIPLTILAQQDRCRAAHAATLARPASAATARTVRERGVCRDAHHPAVKDRVQGCVEASMSVSCLTTHTGL
jgi:hypothetical protein